MDIDLAYPVSGADQQREHGYDDAGRLLTATDTAGPVFSFTYEDDGRIKTNTGRTYTYKTAPTESQRLDTMVVGGVTTSFVYDSRGRRDTQSAPGVSIDYVYDDADRMIGFTRDEAGTANDVSSSYTYDASGQRTSSVVTKGGVTATTDWVYDGITLLRSTAVTNGQITMVEYVNDSAGRPVAAWVSVPATPTPVFVWILTNARGDVLELLVADGSPLAYRRYTPYGELLSSASQAAGGHSATVSSQVQNAVTLRLAGYTWDSESGLYYCSQRYYDPVTCQWITKDPARADGEESAYQYCGGFRWGGWIRAGCGHAGTTATGQRHA